MNIINMILGVPLGFVMYLSCKLTGNYGLAVILFTLIVKIVFFPVNVFTQKNSIRLLQLQPALNEIKQRYAGDKEQINEKQYELYKKEKYNPFVGIIPLLIQLVMIIGVLQVMYNPLQHLLHLDTETTKVLIETTHTTLGVDVTGSGEQLLVIDAVSNPENYDIFSQALSHIPNGEESLQLIRRFDLNFLGINLGEVPSPANPSWLLLVPLLAGITSYIFCVLQNKISPGALSQGKLTGWAFTVVTVGFGLYFTLVMPVGVGVYWIANNLFSILIAFMLNKVYSPQKLAADAIAHIKSTQKTPMELQQERAGKKELTVRNRRDSEKFTLAKKHIVFYALTGGQYKFYKNIIEYILANSNLVVHYLTNDENDALFSSAPKGLIPYYAGQNKSISLFLKMDADIVVTTVQDIQSYHMKRSIVRDDIEYIYTFHGLGSTHLMSRPTAYDHFDTVFCVGPHHVAEMRRRESMSGHKKKNLVKVGYGLYDQLIQSYETMPKESHETPKILIAPSWQTDNILDLCIDDMLRAIIGKGYHIIVRPHPQYVRSFPERMRALADRYAKETATGEIVFELNFSGNTSIFSSDLLITDWSGVAFEYAFCTKKPCVFVNTPMKIMNEDYEQYGLDVLDISLRDIVGVSIDTDNLHTLAHIVHNVLKEKESYQVKIENAMEKYLYYPGRSGEAGGRYILRRLTDRGIDISN